MATEMELRVTAAIHDAQRLGKDPGRAAIRAMRYPTDEMREAWRSVNCQNEGEFTHFYGDAGNWLVCHSTMIDVASPPDTGEG